MTALDLAILNQHAYTLCTTGHTTLADGFSKPVQIVLGTNRPHLLKSDPIDWFGMMTEKDGITFVVLRGTIITSGLALMQEWLEDLLSLPMTNLSDGYGSVHKGFAEIFFCIYPSLMKALHGKDWSKVVFVGHSLGAAVASIAAVKFRGSKLITFASPRVGDSNFSESLTKAGALRYVNAHDHVPDVPTAPPFHHGGISLELVGPWKLYDPGVAHGIANYIIGLQTQTLPDLSI